MSSYKSSNKSIDTSNTTGVFEDDHEAVLYRPQLEPIEEDILMDLEDDVLTKKMALVNEAINQIGFTPFHWKLFCLNGMGYAVDSLLTHLHAVSQTQIAAEYRFAGQFNYLISVNYIGLFVGAVFWGTTADIIGRRIAFHVTLFMTAVFAIAAGGGLSYAAVLSLSCISYSFAGGNLVLDAVIFLELIPRGRQWMLTMMAMWWGIGQIITSAFAWPLIANFSCGEPREDQDQWDQNPCKRQDNMGWRYTYFCCGGFVLICAFARILIVRMVETPKYELTQGNDEAVIKILDKFAASGKVNNPLTIEDLHMCGTIQRDNSDKKLKDKLQPKHALKMLGHNIKGLYSTKKLGITITFSMLSWALIGIAYPLYMAFLPMYLQSRGSATGDGSLNTTYRNNLIVTVCGIIGPILAGPMCEIPKVGRKGTMAIGGVLAMVFMFVYTIVKTAEQNLGILCGTTVFINIYYSTLYAFTPEALPSNHRATGNGLSAALNRVMGVISPVIGYYADISTATPIYVLAALFGVMAVIAIAFPYEVRGRSAM